MEALKIKTRLKKDGEIFIQNLPLISGDEVEIMLLFNSIKEDRSTAADLQNSDIVGLWKNRKDIVDTPGFVVMELIQGCKDKEHQKRLNKTLKKFDILWHNYLCINTVTFILYFFTTDYTDYTD